MSLMSSALTRQKLCVDFGTVKHACPKGIYVAPVPEEPLLWTGVLFVRKGPYANAILRFHIDFPDDYPKRPPVVVFQSDLFHPLVTPLTTFTYSTRDAGADTQSAVDEQRLPPGGLSLRHGFPEWFESAEVQISPSEARSPQDASDAQDEADVEAESSDVNAVKHKRLPHVVELLQYLRIVFDTEDVLDSLPLTAAANAGAWHAWQSFRSKIASRATSGARPADDAQQRSLSPRQQPGGARRPGEWNWQGVWEDRVRRSVQSTLSESVLFGGDNKDVISFLKMDAETISQISPVQQHA
ncbi:Putative ubiquitin-conjugating enzyme E2, ubiquitin-conjugating enzyme/RWD [Septoria linicola]|uniref:Ubiquitin-conjugating enzyme E2, ubiquitin-conjugating enzyme/RWD n=1 Tax=Septoria linicola TaxID=215465 RepID=A0A9Q9EFF0_9PEZI|nr:putative ubiquitin-conjugating enzyme E2, ubiquitin-conjugating enzyme/RWD [Septoria linicola]USW48885.1 Putative ubiquitin-conjugating enzyme E2, ubiquitin-conjugating enzyme/RWD [Septoria linicola]